MNDQSPDIKAVPAADAPSLPDMIYAGAGKTMMDMIEGLSADDQAAMLTMPRMVASLTYSKLGGRVVKVIGALPPEAQRDIMTYGAYALVADGYADEARELVDRLPPLERAYLRKLPGLAQALTPIP